MVINGLEIPVTSPTGRVDHVLKIKRVDIPLREESELDAAAAALVWCGMDSFPEAGANIMLSLALRFSNSFSGPLDLA